MTKINRRNKQQPRVLVITNKAIYNLNDSYQLKRRIALVNVHTISVSSASNGMVLHVPQEYDYLYRFENKEMIDVILRICYQASIKLDHRLNLLEFELDDLSQIAENEKPKIPKNQSCDQYMLLKISQWQRMYDIHSYKHNFNNERKFSDQVSQRNLLLLNESLGDVDAEKEKRY